MDTSSLRLGRGAFLAATAGLAASTLPMRAGAATTSSPVVTVGTIRNDDAAVVNYSQDLGYFRDAGLDVRISFMTSGPAIASAVIGGALDIGVTNVGSVALARSHGVPLKLFCASAVAAKSLMTDVIMVRKDSPIQTGADLDDKVVAIVAVKTMLHAAILAWIDKNGGDSKTVKFIEIPFPEMLGALDAGRVDAAITVEPFTSAGRAKHHILASAFAAMPPNFLILGFFSTERWLQTHVEQAVEFTTAVRRAAVWANSHERESAAMLARLTGIDPTIVQSMARTTYGTSLDVAMLQPVIDNMLKYGMLDKRIDANDLIWRPPSK